MTLEGKIVTLRPLTTEDAVITLRWRLSERAKFLQRGARTVEEQRAWIISSEQTGDLNFILEYKAAPVGMAALLDINRRHKTAVMGRFLIGEREIVGPAPVFFETDLLISDYGFDRLGMHKIYGDIMEDNTAMLRTRFYLGYKQDGVLRDHYLYDGVYKNTIAVSILEDEYRSICRPKLVNMISLYSRFSC